MGPPQLFVKVLKWTARNRGSDCQGTPSLRTTTETVRRKAVGTERRVNGGAVTRILYA
jgi:hypothetical protein